MKKTVGLLAMLFGASMSLLAHADMNQTMQTPSQPSVNPAQNGSTMQPGSAGSSNSQSGSTMDSGSMNSNGSSSSNDDSSDDDTAS